MIFLTANIALNHKITEDKQGIATRSQSDTSKQSSRWCLTILSDFSLPDLGKYKGKFDRIMEADVVTPGFVDIHTHGIGTNRGSPSAPLLTVRRRLRQCSRILDERLYLFRAALSWHDFWYLIPQIVVPIHTHTLCPLKSAAVLATITFPKDFEEVTKKVLNY